jgi:thiamine pyridinylase
MDQADEYTQYETAPDTVNPSEEAVEMLRKIASITADCRDWEGEFNTFSRASHFNAGHGDAYYGFSEDMSLMPDIIDDISSRCISFSDEGNVPLFYTDIAAMGSHVTDPEHKEACLKLMNLVASEAFLQEVCFGSEETIQYLLPVRENLYTVAAETYPMYGRLYELVMNEDNHLCRFGRDIWVYFTEAASNLHSHL